MRTHKIIYFIFSFMLALPLSGHHFNIIYKGKIVADDAVIPLQAIAQSFNYGSGVQYKVEGNTEGLQIVSKGGNLPISFSAQIEQTEGEWQETNVSFPDSDFQIKPDDTSYSISPYKFHIIPTPQTIDIDFLFAFGDQLPDSNANVLLRITLKTQTDSMRFRIHCYYNHEYPTGVRSTKIKRTFSFHQNKFIYDFPQRAMRTLSLTTLHGRLLRQYSLQESGEISLPAPQHTPIIATLQENHQTIWQEKLIH